jgi:hypothetical protein
LRAVEAPIAVGHRDTGRFLSPVLQGKEAEEGELRGVLPAGRGHGDHAAFFARPVVAEWSGE